jgi:hypothetical protein
LFFLTLFVEKCYQSMESNSLVNSYQGVNGRPESNEPESSKI